MKGPVPDTDRGRSLRRVRRGLRNWHICQSCGRTIAVDAADADGWLVAPYRIDPSMNVVRCYAHITESALRMSFAGRTQHWLNKMAAGRERAKNDGRLHPALEPYPMGDQ